MSLTETVLEGTILADGTLLLDRKPNLPVGRVTVLLRCLPAVTLPSNDAFWQRMQAIWAIPVAGGDAAANRSLEEVRSMREEWDEHQEAIERLQDECRSARQAFETPSN